MMNAVKVRGVVACIVVSTLGFGALFACSSDSSPASPAPAEAGATDAKSTANDASDASADATEGGTTHASCTPSLQNCPANQGCSTLGTMGASDAICRDKCTADTQCQAGEKCGGNAPGAANGLCIPTCAVFGNDCPQGLDCSSWTPAVGSTLAFPFCRPVLGDAGSFGACNTSASECAPGLVCTGSAGNRFCSPTCDDTHACPSAPADAGIDADGGVLTCAFQSMHVGNVGVCSAQ